MESDCNFGMAFSFCLGIAFGLFFSVIHEWEIDIPKDQNRKTDILDCAKTTDLRQCIKTEKFLHENKKAVNALGD